MAVYQHAKTERWVAQVWDPCRRKNRQVGTFASEKDARRAELEAEEAMSRDAGLLKMSVAAWHEQWMQTPTWAPGTRSTNKNNTWAFAEKYGHLLMRDVTRPIARDWITKHPHHYSALSAMFGAAIYEDIVPANPFSRLVKRKVAKRDIRPEWLSETDIDALERAAIAKHGDGFGMTVANMIRFAAETGVRPGELFALQWDDLNPDAGELYVRRAAESKTRTIGPPKSGKPRTVVLSRRAWEAAKSTDPRPGSDLIFHTARGKQFWAPSLSRAWDPVRCLIGRPDMDFYELRHYCATRLLEQGVDEADVAHQLGHQDGGRLVREVYGHPSHRHARDRLRRAMDLPPKKPLQEARRPQLDEVWASPKKGRVRIAAVHERRVQYLTETLTLVGMDMEQFLGNFLPEGDVEAA